MPLCEQCPIQDCCRDWHESRVNRYREEKVVFVHKKKLGLTKELDGYTIGEKYREDNSWVTLILENQHEAYKAEEWRVEGDTHSTAVITPLSKDCPKKVE